jgi:hypothetical protein
MIEVIFLNFDEKLKYFLEIKQKIFQRGKKNEKYCNLQIRGMRIRKKRYNKTEDSLKIS